MSFKSHVDVYRSLQAVDTGICSHLLDKYCGMIKMNFKTEQTARKYFLGRYKLVGEATLRTFQFHQVLQLKFFCFVLCSLNKTQKRSEREGERDRDKDRE